MKVPLYLIPAAFYLGFLCRHYITGNRWLIRKLIKTNGHF